MKVKIKTDLRQDFWYKDSTEVFDVQQDSLYSNFYLVMTGESYGQFIRIKDTTPETFKVRVVKSTNEFYWYSNSIGEVFNVCNVRDNISEIDYVIKDNTMINGWNVYDQLVLKRDCVVVTEDDANKREELMELITQTQHEIKDGWELRDTNSLLVIKDLKIETGNLTVTIWGGSYAIQAYSLVEETDVIELINLLKSINEKSKHIKEPFKLRIK